MIKSCLRQFRTIFSGLANISLRLSVQLTRICRHVIINYTCICKHITLYCSDKSDKLYFAWLHMWLTFLYFSDWNWYILWKRKIKFLSTHLKKTLWKSLFSLMSWIKCEVRGAQLLRFWCQQLWPSLFSWNDKVYDTYISRTLGHSYLHYRSVC